MRYWIGIVMVVLFGHTHAQNLENSFKKGNIAYQDKDFAKAIEEYQKITAAGFESPAVYFNLANAYFKTNRLPEAILNYERAALLAPYDSDIQQNLRIARQATIDRFEEMPQPMIRTAYLGILTALSPSGWAYVALFLLLVFLVGSYLYFFSSRRRMGFTLGLTGLATGMLSLFLAFSHHSYNQANRPGIVMATSSYVKSGPGEKAEDVFILHEGTKALITEDFEGWKKIRLPDGKVGWIEAQDIQEI